MRGAATGAARDERSDTNGGAFFVLWAIALLRRWVRPESPVPAVVVAKDASWHERAAAAEIRRYYYLRTGDLLDLGKWSRSPGSGRAVAVVEKGGTFTREIGGRRRGRPDRRPRARGLLAEDDPAPVRRSSSSPAAAVRPSFTAPTSSPRSWESASSSRATSSLTGPSKHRASTSTRRATRSSPSAASSPSTIFRRGRTGGTKTLTRPSWASSPSSG